MTGQGISAWETHAVTNQPPPLEGANLFTADRPLREAARQYCSIHGTDRFVAYGERAGGDLTEAGFEANRQRPELRTHDRYGHRIDEVRFHPAYHALMTAAIDAGIHSLSWDGQAAPDTAMVDRAVLMYLHNQADAGTMCPITMTHAAMPALRQAPDLVRELQPLLLSRIYDPRPIPWWEKRGVTVGMGMTEKQGGSDVRANTTRARATDAGHHELTGHKWFLSAPMSDAFLVLAQANGGLSCFLLPRWRRDGQRNTIQVQRLKDKQGNNSNASGEVEFRGAEAYLVGAEGRGIATIMPMVALTRLDCMIGSASLMRQGVTQALHHCRHREAFGRPLASHPLMENVLADLAIESEAALLLSLRLARALSLAEADAGEAALARIGTAIGKFWVCKRAPALLHEAQECLGGNGYVEESILPRLYREAPVNSIWEGSGNIQCLDVLRAMEREPSCLDALRDLLSRARGRHSGYDLWWKKMKATLRHPVPGPQGARRLVESLATGMQAALLLTDGSPAEAEAFCAGRLAGPGGRVFGALPEDLHLEAIVARASPQGREPSPPAVA